MKNFKFTIIAILLIYPLYWCYDNLIYFEYDRILIYQGEKEEPFERDEPYTNFYGYDSLCDEFPDFKDKAESKLGFDLNTLDMSKYQFLYIYGGDIKSYRVVRNYQNWFPDIKYKNGISKKTVSVYLIKDDRYLEMYDMF